MSSRESIQSNDGREELCSEASRCFEVKMCSGNVAVVAPRPGWISCFDALLDRLEKRGFQAKLVERGDMLFLVFFRLRKSWKPLIFLAALTVTIATVLLAGFDVARAFSVFSRGSDTPILAFAFLAGLLGPLAVHESGHLAAARRGRVPVSLPIFLPAPPPSLGGIGTFGAFINMRGLARDRESLALLGLMGPLMGFIAALPIAWLGLQLSPVLPPSHEVVSGAGLGFAPLILLLLVSSLDVPRNYVLVLHPLALASFIVFIVTFLNLLPIGQLDGAHVVYALFGERVHRAAGYATLIGSMLLATIEPSLSVVAFFSLLAYALNAILAKGRHPGVLNPYKPVTPWKAAIVAACYVLLLLLTTPVPLS